MKKTATKNDWQITSMPVLNTSFQIKRHFSEAQMYALSKGSIPCDMDDRWFFYREDDCLYMHRSWSGFCIYIIHLNPTTDVHTVIANRDPKQYSCDDVDVDTQIVNELLDWWAQPEFDTLSIDEKEYPAVYFHKPEEPYGFLSNWYLSPFTLDGIVFSSVEQYIMYRKCMLFGDDKSAKSVMETQDPAKQQLIARSASGYNDTVWKGIRQVIATRGIIEKFRQNPDLQAQLLETKDAYLIECAVSDRAWACGISLYSGARRNISNWKGSNILGFTLMEVRSILDAED